MYLNVVYLIFNGAGISNPAISSAWVIANKIVETHFRYFTLSNKFSINKAKLFLHSETEN